MLTLLLTLATLAQDAPRAETNPPAAVVLLDFTADWCQPCRQMRPVIAKLKRDGVTVREVDIDRDKATAAKYGVRAIPTFIAIEAATGRELERTKGAQPGADLAAMIKRAEAKAKAPKGPPRRAGDALDAPAAAPKPPANPHPLSTAVRIRTDDDATSPSGSGVVVESDGRRVVILTCAHVLRPGHKVWAELRGAGEPPVVAADVLAIDHATDLALIAANIGGTVPASRVAPAAWRIAPGMGMRSVGCSNGGPPTAREVTVLEIDSPQKTSVGETRPITACDGATEPGRSGGGLFTDDGYICGVTQYGDGGGGLYATPAEIRALLDKAGLGRVYGATEAITANPPTPPADGPPSLTPPTLTAAASIPIGGVDRSKFGQPGYQESGDKARKFTASLKSEAGDDEAAGVPDDVEKPWLVVIGTADQRKPIMESVRGDGKLGKAAKGFRVHEYEPTDKYVRSYKATAANTPMVAGTPGNSRVPAFLLLAFKGDPQQIVDRIAQAHAQLRVENPNFDPEKAAREREAGTADVGGWVYGHIWWIVVGGVVLLFLPRGRR